MLGCGGGGGDALCAGVGLLGIKPGSGTGGLPDTKGGDDGRVFTGGDNEIRGTGGMHGARGGGGGGGTG